MKTKLELKQKELIRHIQGDIDYNSCSICEKLESEISELEQSSITDDDIEAWALKYEEETYHEPEVQRWIQYGCYCGAKAMRDNEIKHIK
jgi:hypothetical protein